MSPQKNKLLALLGRPKKNASKKTRTPAPAPTRARDPAPAPSPSPTPTQPPMRGNGREFLVPTKLHLQILDHFVEKMGYGSGVHKLYRRLHVIFGEKDHPAMDDQGNVVYTKDGDVWEELNTPKNVKNHSYVHDGTKYTYETREVINKGKKSIERRKFLPTRLAIQDFLSKNETHQKNRMPKQRPAAGVRNPPKSSIGPIIPENALPLDIVAADSFRMPKTIHKGKEFSWVVVFVCAVTKGYVFRARLFKHNTKHWKQRTTPPIYTNVGCVQTFCRNCQRNIKREQSVPSTPAYSRQRFRVEVDV